MLEEADAAVLTPAELASYFKVSTATVARWAKKGKLPSFRTPGGQRRYRLADIEQLLREEEETSDAS